MKKWFALLLAVIMVATMMPMAMAEEPMTIHWTYTDENPPIENDWLRDLVEETFNVKIEPVVASDTERYTEFYSLEWAAGKSYDFYFAKRELTSDKDENGKTISGSLREKTLDLIDGLDLSAEQKDILYLAEGYSEKTMDDAPWNQSEVARYALKAPKIEVPELKVPELKVPELKALQLPAP